MVPRPSSQVGIVGPEMSGPPLLGILWRGRGLGQIGILLGFEPLQYFLRVLRLRILEPLESGHGLLRVFHAMKASVDDSELIPSLLDDFGIGAGSGGGALKMPSGCGIIAKEHFRAAKIVVRVAESGL